MFESLPAPIQTALGIANEFSGVISGLGLALLAIPGAGAAVLSAIGTIGTTLAAVATGPIGIAVAAIGGLWLAWKTWGDDVSALVKSVYDTVKLWLWDKFEPVLTPIIGLLNSIGEMFEAFAKLVGAVAMKVLGYAKDIFAAVSTWLWDKLQPVINPLLALIGRITTTFSAVYTAVSTIVQNIYTAVKTWLLDRFAAIVDGVRQKIDAVTGFFRDMYDKVVGNSYVPDMIAAIGQHFATLPAVMVEPSATATATVTGQFSGMMTTIAGAVGEGLADLLTKGGQFSGEFSGIFSALGSNLSRIVGTTMSTLSRIFSESSNKILNDIGKILGGTKALGDVKLGGPSGLIFPDPISQAMFNEWFKAATGPHFISPGAQQDLDMQRAIEEAAYMGISLEEYLAQYGGWMNQNQSGFRQDDNAGWDRLGIGSSTAGFGWDGSARRTGEKTGGWLGDYVPLEDGSYGIPALADGGLVMGETLARIGEAGPEAVVPLERMESWIDYRKLGAAVADALRGNPPVIELDGIRFGKATLRYTARATEVYGLATG